MGPIHLSHIGLSITAVETCMPPWHIRPVYMLLPHPPPRPRPYTTHTKGYHAGTLICMWNVLSYASSSVLSAICLLPRDSESHVLLIEWVLVWNTHTHWKTSIHPLTHTHTLVALLQMLGGSGMGVRPSVMGEHQSLLVSLAFSFFTPTPLFISSYFFSASLISLCFEWWFVWRMQSKNVDMTLAVRRCYRSQLRITSLSFGLIHPSRQMWLALGRCFALKRQNAVTT